MITSGIKEPTRLEEISKQLYEPNVINVNFEIQPLIYTDISEVPSQTHPIITDYKVRVDTPYLIKSDLPNYSDIFKKLDRHYYQEKETFTESVDFYIDNTNTIGWTSGQNDIHECPKIFFQGYLITLDGRIITRKKVRLHEVVHNKHKDIRDENRIDVIAETLNEDDYFFIRR